MGKRFQIMQKTFVKKLFFYFVYIVCYKNISKDLIINMDQICIILIFDNNNNTYKIKIAKQVFIYKKKIYIFIAILFTDLSGKVLPIQSIWKGVLAINLPTIVVSKEVKKKSYQFKFNK